MSRTRTWLPSLLVAALLLSCNCAVPDKRGDEKSPPSPEAPVACLGLDPGNCRENPDSEAIPYWGESLVACEVDQRGFAANCPFEGCRPAGADCPTLAELSKRCPSVCSYNDFGIDTKTGCRTCKCRHR